MQRTRDANPAAARTGELYATFAVVLGAKQITTHEQETVVSRAQDSCLTRAQQEQLNRHSTWAKNREPVMFSQQQMLACGFVVEGVAHPVFDRET